MNWMLGLYPARWRLRYGEEFGTVLAGQRASPGLVLDVVAGAIDAHLHPQIRNSHSQPTKGDTMTLAMLQRCAAGGPKLSPQDKKIARSVTIWSALAIAALEIGLAKTFHGAPAVLALVYWSAPALGLIYEQTAYLRQRSWQTHAFVLGGGLTAMYAFMLAVCMVKL